jgi:60 kDa SS-A/Ro ribonucleoprotein
METYTNATKTFSQKATPQSKPIVGKNQVMNNAGGYVFATDKWTNLDRFLILGSAGGTYYVTPQKLTEANSEDVINCIQEDGARAVQKIVDVSVEGRAPKNDPAIYALALACTYGDPETKKQAYGAIEKVCRIGTHIFTFCELVNKLRGWSRGLRTGVSNYYTKKEESALAYQLIKYQQRGNWAHHDVLNLAHPPKGHGNENLLGYAVGGKHAYETLPEIIKARDIIKRDATVQTAVNLIASHGLPREAIPTELLNEVKVWEALLHKMPMTAMIRNLGKMSQVGLLTNNLDNSVKQVCDRLSDAEYLKKSRVHPMTVLTACKVYARGRGVRGSSTWSPVPKIVDALDEAFYKAFDNVEPTNKNIYIGLDVSGSMCCPVVGDSVLSCSEASVAMSMITARTEPNYTIHAFSGDVNSTRFWGRDAVMKKFPVSPRQRIDDVVKAAGEITFGGTDCSLPMRHALENKIPVDTFIIYTDNETWAGDIHPVQALKEYRQKMGRDAKLIVVGMATNGFSIADPNDKGTLDIVGLDTSVPQIMSQFINS